MPEVPDAAPERGPWRNSKQHSSTENESGTLAQVWSLLVVKLTNSGHFWTAQLLLGEFRISPQSDFHLPETACLACTKDNMREIHTCRECRIPHANYRMGTACLEDEKRYQRSVTTKSGFRTIPPPTHPGVLHTNSGSGRGSMRPQLFGVPFTIR